MNQLTPENLDRIKRLQPLFKEKMGDWQVGDEYVEPNGDIYTITRSDIRTWEVIPELSDCLDDCLRIPKPIDGQNPGRGCLGMLKEDKKFVSLFYSEKGFACQVHKINSPILYSYEASDPFTALLKALCAQEGV